jgi:hypothetical protein
MLELLHETALRNGLLFVYPIRGGALNGSTTNLQVNFNNTYDAIREGTFETIVELIGSLAATSTANTQTSSYSVTSVGNQFSEPAWAHDFLYLILGVAAAIAVGCVALVALKLRKSPPS